VGSVGVLTRCCLPEIRTICPESSTSFSIHCVGTPRGIRKITLHFFTPGHCHLFQFALDQLASPGACTWLPISTTCIPQRIDYARRVLLIPFHGGPYGTLGAGSGLETEDLEVVSGQFRAIHPFYDVQTVWPSRVTPSLRDWLGDREKQRHFIHGVEEVRVLSHVPCITAFHRTPTEAAIESALYGVGTWLSGNESDVSNE
jgi:hypothetical protein